MYEVMRIKPLARPLFTPAIDIHEDEQGMTLCADLPGVTKESVDVSFENNVLRIFGRVQDSPPEGGRPVYHEYRAGDYYRSFILTDEIDADAIRAELDNGVLTLSLPKVKRSGLRKIEV